MPEILQDAIEMDQIWMPDDVRVALGCDEFPVIYFVEGSEDEIIDNCSLSVDIGLTHIRLDIGKRILVCLTTVDRIYVLDMTEQDHVAFLHQLLNRPGLSFYTVRGQHLAYVLNQEFNIVLKKTFDLSSFDIFLAMRRASMNGALLGQYTVKTLVNNNGHIVYHDRYDLALIYLNVSMTRLTKGQGARETNIIKTRPESTAAANIIRKRSCLIRAMALKMRQDFEKLMYQDVDNIYEFAHKVRGTRYIEYENLGSDTYDKMIEFLQS